MSIPPHLEKIMDSEDEHILEAYRKEWRKIGRIDRDGVNDMLQVAREISLPAGIVRTNCADLEDIRDVAKKWAHLLHTFCGDLVRECNGNFETADPKTDDRVKAKVENDYGGDYSRIFDVERCMGIFTDPNDMAECLRRIKAVANAPVERHGTTFSIRRFKDRLNNPIGGYRDVMVNIEVGHEDPFIGELQLTFEGMRYVKKGGHAAASIPQAASTQNVSLAPAAASIPQAPSNKRRRVKKTVIDYGFKGEYDGEVDDLGWRDGYGSVRWANGESYDGEWRNDKREGQGEYTWPSGNECVYVGEWRNDKKEGRGKYTWHDGSEGDGGVYEGEWKDDKYDGWGKYTFASSGVVREGRWKNGVEDGAAIELSKGEDVSDQVWENGKCVSFKKR